MFKTYSMDLAGRTLTLETGNFFYGQYYSKLAS